ncbi:Arm DNA-binding domain-containing protein [Giesbergeria anulus]|uniref:Integrase DNA-binding domain-containing protein n=1 Tax=Giesbergeria anulus TaxID=180197 RepID=A0A1H9QST0_9BURK|nr:Arm DNA-binding domain-containing protein [Giesbergeria anulus]SER63295.1 hypothetical protein SAMN02982919_02732 [Giesbergeria anulus]
MALTDSFIKNTKPGGKPAGDKHSDGGGMFLRVKASGKYWRYAIYGKRILPTMLTGKNPAHSTTTKTLVTKAPVIRKHFSFLRYFCNFYAVFIGEREPLVLKR